MQSVARVAFLVVALVAAPALAQSALLVPNDPYFPQQPGLQLVRAPHAWDTSTGTADANVCVIDSGVRASHEDLAERYLGGHDFANGDSDPTDDHGHGTMMTGIAAAGLHNGVGVSGMGNVGYQAVKVLTASGSGTFTSFANGVVWCHDHGGPRTVILVGLGSSANSSLVQDTIRAVVGAGRIVVAGTGASANIGFPANMPEVIAVACSTAQETACSISPRGPSIDLVAPGLNIVTTGAGSDTDYRFGNGTSWSAAMVAGALALYWSHEPTLTGPQLQARLLATAQDLGAPGFDETFGCGELDVRSLFDGPVGNATCGAAGIGVPRSLAAAPGVGQIALSWQPPATDGGSPVTHYRVWGASTCASAFEPLAEVPATDHVETGLAAGVTRCYRVTAVTALAESAPSATASARTLVPPEAPRDLRAEPGTGLGSVRLRWNLAAGGGPVEGFAIERRDPGSDFVEVARIGRVASFVDTDVSLAGWYAYRVRAFNAAGESAPSDAACARPSPWAEDARLDAAECAIAAAWPAVS